MEAARAWVRDVALGAALVLPTAALWVAASRARSRTEAVATAAFAAARADFARQAAGRIRYGDTGPDFTLPDSRGRRASLDGLVRRSRFVAIAFVGRPSKMGGAEARDLERLLRAFGRHGFGAAAVIVGPADGVFPRWLPARLTLPILHDRTGRVARAYGAKVLPFNVLLDAHRRVVLSYRGYAINGGATYLAQKVQALFAGTVSLPAYDPEVPGPGGSCPAFLAERAPDEPFEPRNLRGRWALLVVGMRDCPSCFALEQSRGAVGRLVRRLGGVPLWADIWDSGPAQQTQAGNGFVMLSDPLLEVTRLFGGMPLPRAYLIDPAGLVAAVLPPPLSGPSLSQAVLREVAQWSSQARRNAVSR